MSVLAARSAGAGAGNPQAFDQPYAVLYGELPAMALADIGALVQHQIPRPVQFHAPAFTLNAVQEWFKLAALKLEDILFRSWPVRGECR